MAVFADGRRALSGSDDRTLKLWDLQTGKATATLKGHEDGVMAVAVFADGRRALSGSDDRTLKVWDLKARKCLATFTGESAIVACAVAPDGRTIVAGETSGRVHFLRLEAID